jgi:hypothetical protein
VRPTLDTRAVLEAVIEGTFDLTPAQADRVFSGSRGGAGPYAISWLRSSGSGGA